MLEMTTKMILEMLLHRNEIQKRIFQTQSDCATFEMNPTIGQAGPKVSSQIVYFCMKIMKISQ